LDSLKKTFRIWWLYPALFLLLAGLIFFTGQIYWQNIEKSAVHQAVADLQGVAEFKVEQVSRWLEARMNTADTLIMNPGVVQWLGRLVQQPDDAVVQEEALQWLQRMKGKYGYGDGAIVSPAGEVVLTVRPDMMALMPAVRSLLAETRQSGAPRLSNFYLTTNALPVRLALAIPFALPAVAAQGTNYFHLLIRINPYEYFFKLLNTWPTPNETGEMLLVQREQDEVVVLNEARFQPGSALVLRQALTHTNAPNVRAVLGETEMVEGVDYRGVKVFAVAKAVPRTDWFLVLTQHHDEIMAGLVPARRLVWLTVCVAIWLIGMLVVLLAQSHRLHLYRRESELEDAYHSLFDHVVDVVFIKDMQGRILMANAVACERYGYSRAEFLQLTTMDLIAPEEQDHVPGFMRELQASGQAIFETIHRRKDGTTMPVEVSARLAEFRSQPALLAVIRDLAPRRQAEADFEKQRQLLLTLINALPDHIYVKDAQHRFLLANESTARLMGVASPADLLGKTDHDFFKQELADGYAADERTLLASGQALINREEVCVAPNGREVWFSSTKVPLRDQGGQVVGLVGIRHDITAFKQLTGKLQATYARSIGLELAITRSPAVVLLHSRGLDSPLEYVSDNVSRWGYEAVQLVGQTELPWIHAEDRERVTLEIRQRLAGHATEFLLHYRLLTRAGEVRWIEEHIRVAGDAADALQQAQSLLIDVTAHRALEEELRQAQKMETIGRLAGGIAHDFNNLLQVILGFSELLAGEVVANERQRRDVHEIQTAAQRARDLTNRLLAFSRKQMLQPTRVNLNALLAGERAALGRTLGGTIELHTEFAPDLWPVKVDQGQLQQIITHLCANARDAMPSGGRLTLSTRNLFFSEEDVRLHPDARVGAYVCLAVSDSGKGMTDEVRAHIFEPFFTTKEPGRGTGLGLAMAYGIIKQHEGWIHVYSQAGQGTTFKLYLPVLVAAGVSAPTPPAKHLAGLRVLLIEDEDGVRDLANRVLRGQGCTVLAASTCTEAETHWRKEGGGFDVVLSDVVLPDGNGLDLVDRWRAAGARCLFILSSGYTDERARWPVIAERGYHFLQKPYPASELIRLLAQQAVRL
jgi:PAS domain S-box-containing protein